MSFFPRFDHRIDGMPGVGRFSLASLRRYAAIIVHRPPGTNARPLKFHHRHRHCRGSRPTALPPPFFCSTQRTTPSPRHIGRPETLQCAAVGARGGNIDPVGLARLPAARSLVSPVAVQTDAVPIPRRQQSETDCRAVFFCVYAFVFFILCCLFLSNGSDGYHPTAYESSRPAVFARAQSRRFLFFST